MGYTVCYGMMGGKYTVEGRRSDDAMMLLYPVVLVLLYEQCLVALWYE